VDSSTLTANIPLLHFSSHPEEAGMDANSFTVSTFAILHIISFAGVSRNYSSNHLPWFAPNYFTPWGPTWKGQPVGFHWAGRKVKRKERQILPSISSGRSSLSYKKRTHYV